MAKKEKSVEKVLRKEKEFWERYTKVVEEARKILNRESPYDELNLPQNIPPTYGVDYGVQHCERILERLEDLCRECDLSPFEIFNLFCSVWLHDIGMFIEVEKEERLETTVKMHGERGAGVMEKKVKDGVLPLELEAPTIAELCREHTSETLLSAFPRTKQIGEHEIRLKLLIGLLRIADLCDIDNRRSHEALFVNHRLITPWINLESLKKEFCITSVEVNLQESTIDISFREGETVEGIIASRKVVRKIKERVERELRAGKEAFEESGIGALSVRIKNHAGVQIRGFEDLEVKKEGIRWRFFKYTKEAEGESPSSLIRSPITNEEELRACFVKFSKIERFEEELQKRKFRKDFLLRSAAGTGKTSMLTYLSSKATEGGYSVFWVEPTYEVPSAQGLMSRVSNLELVDSRIIFVFDDIQKNPSIVQLLSELKTLYPKVTIWVSLKKEASEEIKKRWIAVEREIAAEDLPGTLDREDIKRILDEKFKELLDEKSRNWILRQTKEQITISYFSSLYANLIENQLVPPNWKEPETLIIRKTSFDPLENYKNLIIKQGKFEKFVLEVVSYLDGAPTLLLQQMLHSYGAQDSSSVLSNILDRQLAYKQFCYRFIPEAESVELIKVDSALQDLVREEVADWDRKNTFPEILLDIGEREEGIGREALLALYNEYENLPQEEKEKYVRLLLKKKQNPTALWIASDLSEFDDKLLSLAEETLKEKEKEFPSQLFFNFGFSHTRRDQFEKAISYYKRAIYTGLKLSADWDRYGQCFLEIGNYKEAITSFEKAISLDPKNSIAWVDLGIAKIAIGDSKEAIKCFEKAVDIDPRNSEAWNKLGACYAQLNEHEEAISCFKKAVGVNPKDFVAWHRMEVSFETLSK